MLFAIKANMLLLLIFRVRGLNEFLTLGIIGIGLVLYYFLVRQFNRS